MIGGLRAAAVPIPVHARDGKNGAGEDPQEERDTEMVMHLSDDDDDADDDDDDDDELGAGYRDDARTRTHFPSQYNGQDPTHGGQSFGDGCGEEDESDDVDMEDVP